MNRSARTNANRTKALAELFLHKLRTRGVADLVRGVAGSARYGLVERAQPPAGDEAAFDAEYGTDTGGIVPLWKLTIDSPHRAQGVRYQASDPDFVRRAIESLPIRPEEFVFLDIGSGKGRTLLVASEYPFEAVTGIEFAADLNKIALDNIRRYRSPKRKCRTVMSLCEDAVRCTFPRANTVLYMYNPFDEGVLAIFLDRLRASLTDFDRKLFLIYRNPSCSNLLDDCDFLAQRHADLDAAIYSYARPGRRDELP